jgi:hypothetical protein
MDMPHLLVTPLLLEENLRVNKLKLFLLLMMLSKPHLRQLKLDLQIKK